MKPILLVLVISMIWLDSANGDLASFVTEKLEEFPAWLLANGLDPFPFSTSPSEPFTPTNPRNLTIYADISRVKLHGISISPNVSFGYGALHCGYFSVENPFAPKFSVSGVHETWYSTQLIDNDRAQGNWTANFNRKYNEYGYDYTVDFSILPSGHLEIANIDKSPYLTYSYPSDIYFEGISDNPALVEYKEEIASLLRGNLAFDFADLDSHLITRAFGRYWAEVFLKFTSQDIIDHGTPATTNGTPETKVKKSIQHLMPHPKECSRKRVR